MCDSAWAVERDDTSSDRHGGEGSAFAVSPRRWTSGLALTPAPLVPTTKDDCKNGGYRRFGPPAGSFRNQGQCISYVQHHSRVRP
jgi:hypothetical protein